MLGATADTDLALPAAAPGALNAGPHADRSEGGTRLARVVEGVRVGVSAGKARRGGAALHGDV